MPDISQEELDAKIAAAKVEAASAKESEMQAEAERIKAEADKRVAKMQEDSAKKVSEQGAELGTLRKTAAELKTWREANEAKVTEYETLKQEKERIEQEAKDRKVVDEKPETILSTMTDAEEATLNEAIKALPEEQQKAFTDSATAEKALAESLLGLRDAGLATGLPLENPATAWRARSKQTAPLSSGNIRDAIRKQLTETDPAKRKVAGGGGAPGGQKRGGEEEDKRTPAERFIDYRTSAGKKE